MEKKILPLLLLVIAYQWIIAFFNKVVTKNFFNELHKQMKGSVSDITFHPYATLFKNVGIPHFHLFGTMVMLSELFVGVVFLLYSIQKLMGKNNHIIAKLGLAATVIGAFMNLNYALLGGDTLFVSSDNAFQEAISVDWFMFLMQVILIGHFYTASVKKNQENEIHQAA
ncbi:hypothetical protein HPT25_20690 [Bacillus sp. BRMEA1]|uniref:hypothetical protein n=1 Tax=Neobacillus endophyticus TaxID=2738405 RepID=UPI0015672F5A|nr:hypothetical protein [Neobacillus endophyticus]NRD79758.1 hypothetical protein [Neobacillus endophyticus]